MAYSPRGTIWATAVALLSVVVSGCCGGPNGLKGYACGYVTPDQSSVTAVPSIQTSETLPTGDPLPDGSGQFAGE